MFFKKLFQLVYNLIICSFHKFLENNKLFITIILSNISRAVKTGYPTRVDPIQLGSRWVDHLVGQSNPAHLLVNQ